MSFLSKEFGSCAIGATTASKTMLASLGSITTAVKATPVQAMNVKADAAGAGALAAQNAGIAQGMKADVNAARGQIADTIRSAQMQVAAAMQIAGHDAGSLYPDAMAGGTEVEFLAQAAIGGMDGMGGGSAAMALLKNAPSIATALDEMSCGSDKAAAEADAQKILIAAYSGPVDTREGQFGLVMNVNDTPSMHAVSLNWEAFFANGHEIADLMALDPDNPNPDIVPEIRELDALDGGLNQLSAELLYVQENYQVSAAAVDHTVIGADCAPMLEVDGDSANSIVAGLGEEQLKDLIANAEAVEPLALQVAANADMPAAFKIPEPPTRMTDQV